MIFWENINSPKWLKSIIYWKILAFEYIKFIIIKQFQSLKANFNPDFKGSIKQDFFLLKHCYYCVNTGTYGTYCLCFAPPPSKLLAYKKIWY